MIETHTCIVVLCDTCGDDWYENGFYHFDTLEEARTYLVDKRAADDPEDPYYNEQWQIEDGKPVLCPRCVNKQTCATEGHAWSEWLSPRGREMFASRHCQRCDKGDTNIGDLVEQMVAEVSDRG